MRVLVIAFSAVALIGAAPPTKPFDYKGYVAGQLVEDGVLEKCRTKISPELEMSLKLAGVDSKDDDDYEICSDSSAKVAGVSVISEHIGFYKKRLSNVTILSDVIAFKTITDAMKQKYGPPCRSGVKRLQALTGAKVDSAYYVWCFASGEMTADMFYPDLKTSTIEYQDKHRLPASKPKVDF